MNSHLENQTSEIVINTSDWFLFLTKEEWNSYVERPICIAALGVSINHKYSAVFCGKIIGQGLLWKFFKKFDNFVCFGGQASLILKRKKFLAKIKWLNWYIDMRKAYLNYAILSAKRSEWLGINTRRIASLNPNGLDRYPC